MPGKEIFVSEKILTGNSYFERTTGGTAIFEAHYVTGETKFLA